MQEIHLIYYKYINIYRVDILIGRIIAVIDQTL